VLPIPIRHYDGKAVFLSLYQDTIWQIPALHPMARLLHSLRGECENAAKSHDLRWKGASRS